MTTALAAPDVKSITAALAEPFDPAEVKWKPAMVKGGRAMALAYVDARVVQDRLDEVLGCENWQDDYQVLTDGSVSCKLRLHLGGEWVTKMDVGSPSEQPDGGDRLKAAFSDALKRTAVKFGVARYIYRLPSQWVDYDPVKKLFVRAPTLPDWARPTPASPAKGDADESGGGKPPDILPGQRAEIDRLGKLHQVTNSRLRGLIHQDSPGATFPALTAAQADALLARLRALPAPAAAG
jgi:hypothetical protein